MLSLKWSNSKAAVEDTYMLYRSSPLSLCIYSAMSVSAPKRKETLINLDSALMRFNMKSLLLLAGSCCCRFLNNRILRPLFRFAYSYTV